MQEETQPQPRVPDEIVDAWRSRFESDMLAPEKETLEDGTAVRKTSEGALLRASIDRVLTTRNQEDYDEALAAIAGAEFIPKATKKKSAETEPVANRLRQLATEFLSFVAQTDPEGVKNARARSQRREDEVRGKAKSQEQSKKELERALEKAARAAEMAQEAAEVEAEQAAEHAAKAEAAYWSQPSNSPKTPPLSKAGKKKVAAALEALRATATEAGVQWKSQHAPVNANDRSTVAGIREALTAWFIGASDRLHVVQSIHELPMDIKIAIEEDGVNPDTVQGFVLGNRAYMVADNIKSGSETAVFLHEVGAHLGLSAQTVSDVSARIKLWATSKVGSKERAIYDAAKARMEAAGETSDAELVAYTTEEAAKAGVVPRAVKTGKGLTHINSVQDLVDVLTKMFSAAVKQLFGAGNVRFSAQNLVDVVYGAAQSTMTTQAQHVGTSTPQFSRAITMDEVFRSAGREAPTPDRRSTAQRIQETIIEAIPKPAAGKGYIQTAIDNITNALDISVPLLHAIRDELRKSMPDSQANEILAALSMSQVSHADGVAALALLSGGIKFDAKTGKFVTETSKNNLREMAKIYDQMAKKYNKSTEYIKESVSLALEAKRLKGLMQSDKSIVPHMTKEQVDAALQAYDLMPEIKEVESLKQGIRDWTKDLMVKNGVWSQEYASEMLDALDWVPFNREYAEAEERRSGFTKMVQGLQVKAKEPEIVGSERKVHNVLDNFERWVEYSIQRAVSNNMATRLADASVKYLPPEVAKKVGGVPNGAEARTVYYLKNGEPQYILFDDPLKAQLFKGTEPFGMATLPIIAGAINTFNRAFRGAILNFPLFPVYQLAMDSLSAVTLSGLPAKYAFKIPAKAVAEALKTMRNDSLTHEHLKQYGAVGVRDWNATMAKADADLMAGMSKISGIARYTDYMQHIGMVADNAVRQAVYLAAKESGATEADAVERAFEVINFRTRLGSKGLTHIARNVVFFNAFLAANRAMLKVITGEGIAPKERAEAWKIFKQNMGYIFGLSLMFALMNTGDDDYEKMSRGEQAAKITLPGLGGWGIPLRPDVLMLPKFLAETIVRQSSDKYADDPAKLRATVKDMLLTTMFSGPMPVPQPMILAGELASNYSVFTGRPIVGSGLQKHQAFSQYGAGTSELAKGLGIGVKNLLDEAGIPSEGLSPLKIDHFIRGAGGMYGAALLMLTNEMLGNRPNQSLNDVIASLPGMGRVGVKEFDSATKTDFYDLAQRVDAVVSTANRFKQLGKAHEYQDYIANNQQLLQARSWVTNVSNTLSQIRRQILAVSESDTLTPEQKYNQIHSLRVNEAAMLKRLEGPLKHMRERIS